METLVRAAFDILIHDEMIAMIPCWDYFGKL
jgi:hypothetical protein